MKKKVNDESAVLYNSYYLFPAFLVHKQCDFCLKPVAALLFCVVVSLSLTQGYCYATNVGLGEIINRNGDTVSTLISELCNMGILKRVIIYKSKDNKKRYLSPNMDNEYINQFIKKYYGDSVLAKKGNSILEQLDTYTGNCGHRILKNGDMCIENQGYPIPENTGCNNIINNINNNKFNNIHLSQKESSDLYKKYPKELVCNTISEYSEWKTKKGANNIKSDYEQIVKWLNSKKSKVSMIEECKKDELSDLHESDIPF